MSAALLLVLLLTGDLAESGVGRADPSCPNLSPDQGPLGYHHHSNGDRCEGFFKSNVSGEALTVAFLMAGRLPAAGEVEVMAAGPSCAINVRAVALPLGTYYRMDAKIPPSKALRWPLSEVVNASQSLRSTDLGLYGWLDDAGRLTYVPVRASPPGGPPAGQQAVRLGVRTNVAIDRVVYNIGDDESCHFGSKAWTALSASVPTGAVLTVVLPRDRPNLCVGFRAKLADSDQFEPLTARIRLK